jgi:invasion protein IalB
MKYSVVGVGIAAVAALLCQLQAEATTIEVAQNLQGTTGDTGTALTPQSQPGRLAQAAPPSGQSQQAQPAPAAPKIPTRTEILTFDGWVVTCNEFESQKNRVCSALLQILQQNNGQVVFSWTVAHDSNKQVVAVMQTPTGVLIGPGVELRVGKSPARKIPFTSCETGRCVASMTMDANLLRDLTTSSTAEAVIQGSQGNTVQFNIQMKGFDKAYAALGRS